MALPSNRTEFLEYCLRKLGDGAIEINVTTTQAEDRIDEALYFFQEYHDESTQNLLIKKQFTSTDISNEYLTLGDEVIGVTGFIANSTRLSNNIFGEEYQFWVSNASDLSGSQLQYYYVGMRHLEQIEQMFDYQTAVVFNRHTHRLYIHEDWSTFTAGDYIVLNAYSIVDPDTYGNIWSNRTFMQYATALIKQQWGQNLSKYEGIQVLGGVTFNGQRLLEESREEIRELEERIKVTESTPLGIYIG